MIKLPDNLKDWVEVINNVALLVAGFIAAVWAYSKYVVERGLLPATQFEIELGTVGQQQGKLLLEILLQLKNIGTSTLVVNNLRIDIRYLENNDEPVLFDKGDGKVGRLVLPKKAFLKGDVHSEKEFPENVTPKSDKPSPKQHDNGKEKRGVALIGYDTFVQPGVNQTYTFTTTLPKSTTYILIWGSFEYEPRPSRFQRPILFLSRGLGLAQYSLTHIDEPHTCERFFRLDGAAPVQGAQQTDKHKV